jgi:hypothetical protein
MHSFGLLQHLIWNAFVVIFVCLTLLKRYFNFNVNPMNFFFISNSFSSANAYGAAGRHSRTAAPHGLARQTYPTGGDPWPSLLDAAWGQTRRGARTFTPALVARLACYVIAPGTEGATFKTCTLVSFVLHPHELDLRHPRQLSSASYTNPAVLAWIRCGSHPHQAWNDSPHY